MQFLDNSEKFYEDGASRSRDVQVRCKNILVFNIKFIIPWLISIANINNYQMKTNLRNVLEDITAHCGAW